MLKKLLVIFLLFTLSAFAAGKMALVNVVKIEKGVVNPLQEFIGTINFDRSSILAAQNSGVIKSVNFKVGQSVRKGKILVQIDADILKARIVALRAKLEVAKDTQKNSLKDYLRYKKLLSTKSITQKEYDDALLKSNSSSGSAKALQANLTELLIENSKKRVRAPFSGIIAEKKIDLGEWVNAGTPIAKLIDPSSIKITFNVPLGVVHGLKVGDIYDITIGSKIIKAKLSAIIPDGDRLTRTFPLKFVAHLDNVFVFDGEQAVVSLSKEGRIDALVLPRDAVIKRFGQNIVFAIDAKNIAKMIPVKILGFAGDKIAVSGKGLSSGMTIVSKGNERIFPNSPVKILNNRI